MSHQTLLYRQGILDRHVFQTAVPTQEDGIMYWQVTTVLTWDRTDHLSMGINRIQIIQFVHFVMPIVQSAQEAATDNAQLV